MILQRATLRITPIPLKWTSEATLPSGWPTIGSNSSGSYPFKFDHFIPKGTVCGIVLEGAAANVIASHARHLRAEVFGTVVGRSGAGIAPRFSKWATGRLECISTAPGVMRQSGQARKRP